VSQNKGKNQTSVVTDGFGTLCRKMRRRYPHCALLPRLLYRGRSNAEHIEEIRMSDRYGENASENRFALDQDLQFKAEVRRNKLIGLWAAELLGKEDAAAYAKDVVAADFEEAGDKDVVRKLRADFDAAGLAVTTETIEAKLYEFMGLAVEQIQQD
jgi:hypothetical protein